MKLNPILFVMFWGGDVMFRKIMLLKNDFLKNIFEVLLFILKKQTLTVTPSMMW